MKEELVSFKIEGETEKSHGISFQYMITASRCTKMERFSIAHHGLAKLTEFVEMDKLTFLIRKKTISKVSNSDQKPLTNFLHKNEKKINI